MKASQKSRRTLLDRLFPIILTGLTAGDGVWRRDKTHVRPPGERGDSFEMSACRHPCGPGNAQGATSRAARLDSPSRAAPAGSADGGPRNGASRATSGVRQFSSRGTEEICQGARLRRLAPVLEGHEVGGRRPVRRQGAVAGHRQPPRWRAGPGGSTERDSHRDGAASPQPQETCAEARSSVFPPQPARSPPGPGPPTVPRERHRG